jgi:hypothetical protein
MVLFMAEEVTIVACPKGGIHGESLRGFHSLELALGEVIKSSGIGLRMTFA